MAYYNPATTSTITSVEYAVAKAGNPWFLPTIASSDSPDYSSDVAKAQAQAQCAILSPLGVGVGVVK